MESSWRSRQDKLMVCGVGELHRYRLSISILGMMTRCVVTAVIKRCIYSQRHLLNWAKVNSVTARVSVVKDTFRVIVLAYLEREVFSFNIHSHRSHFRWSGWNKMTVAAIRGIIIVFVKIRSARLSASFVTAGRSWLEPCSRARQATDLRVLLPSCPYSKIPFD